jgi:hypothetical protein
MQLEFSNATLWSKVIKKKDILGGLPEDYAVHASLHQYFLSYIPHNVNPYIYEHILYGKEEDLQGQISLDTLKC